MTEGRPLPCGDNATKIDRGIGEVRLWQVPLDRSEAEIARCRTFLSSEELARCERFRHPRSAQRFVVGRSSLRQILAERLGCRPQDVPIEYDGAGKPRLPLGSGWHFNVTHSEEWALIGLTQLGPIGVDIEKLRHGFAVEPIAQRFFSPPEVADLLTLPSEQRLLAFFRCWTRKEAFIKAIGLGLAYPLDEFDVTLLPDDPPAIRRVKGDDAAGAAWGMYEVPTPSGFVGALVTPTPHARLVVSDHYDI